MSSTRLSVEVTTSSPRSGLNWFWSQTRLVLANERRKVWIDTLTSFHPYMVTPNVEEEEWAGGKKRHHSEGNIPPSHGHAAEEEAVEPPPSAEELSRSRFFAT